MKTSTSLVRSAKKAWAFVKRDFLIATSYRVAFLMQLLSVVLWVPICYFIGEGISSGDSDLLEPYGGDYFAFLLIGMGLLGYMTISLRTFNQSIRESQLMGTLEIMLLSPTSVRELLIYSSLWIYLFLTLRFGMYLLIGALFGLDLGSGNIPAAIVVLMLSIPAFASFGIASAALVLLIKRGESLTVALSTVSLVLGGVLYPVSVLPEWLQPCANLVPITHANEAMRLALFSGYSVRELTPQLGALAMFAFVLLPISLLLFRRAVRWTKASGTLAHY